MLIQTMSTSPKINLLNLNRAALRAYFESLGEKPFRGDQILKWIHHEGLTDFNDMSNLSKNLRATLSEQCEIKLPKIAIEQASQDGTYKWIVQLEDNNSIEMVYIPEDMRGTLCVSSQVGCALKCTFCSTGAQGFNRDLSVAEIIGQVWLAQRQLQAKYPDRLRPITNVVMMGMGEPLQNFNAVVPAMNIMMDDFAYNLSKYRVTLSTSGMVPEMARLKKESEVALAVSLHAPNDELRNILVPLNKKYPLKMLIQACKDYFEDQHKRYVTMEYVMLDGVNDSPMLAKQLVKLLRDVPCKVNLIPFNPFPETQYNRSPKKVIDRFRDILMEAGINTITRRTRGDDIDAACGQLVGVVNKKIPAWKQRQSQTEIHKTTGTNAC